MKYIVLSLLTFSSPSFCHPIHYAACNGQVGIVRELLKQDPSLLENKQNHFKETPFLAAVRGAQPEVVQLFLEAGANPLACDIYGRNGLHLLAVHALTRLRTNPTEETCSAIITVGQLLSKTGTLLMQQDSDAETPYQRIKKDRVYPLYFLCRQETVDMGDCIFHALCQTPFPPGIKTAAEALLFINKPIREDVLETLVKNHEWEQHEVFAGLQELYPSTVSSTGLLVTALACFELQKKPDLARLTKQITPQQFKELQPKVDVKKKELLASPFFQLFFSPKKSAPKENKLEESTSKRAKTE